VHFINQCMLCNVLHMWKYFLKHNAMLAQYKLRCCCVSLFLSVRWFVTSWCSAKMVKHIGSTHGTAFPIFFRHHWERHFHIFTASRPAWTAHTSLCNRKLRLIFTVQCCTNVAYAIITCVCLRVCVCVCHTVLYQNGLT